MEIDSQEIGTNNNISLSQTYLFSTSAFVVNRCEICIVRRSDDIRTLIMTLTASVDCHVITLEHLFRPLPS